MDFKWPFPATFSRVYKVSSSLVLGAVCTSSKIWLTWLNDHHVINLDRLLASLEQQSRPVITVSNHHSTVDDPILWGMLPWRCLTSEVGRMRWILAAHDICFTKSLHRFFFSLGRCVPVVRGDGVYQKGLDFAIDRLNETGWVHIFPEGKVNPLKHPIRLKWGVGRLVAESRLSPIVVPFWHVGVDEILPLKKPYIPKFGKRVTVFVGDVLEFDALLAELRRKGASAAEIRKAITDKIQAELYSLQEKAENAHRAWLATA